MNKTKGVLLVAILLASAVAQVQIVQNFQHIIVGAGLGGIGVSEILTRNSVQHLMIEAKDRVGGRLKSFQFAGTTQDEGASYVHYPYDNNNLLHAFVTSEKLDVIDANFRKDANYYAGNRSLFSDADLTEAEKIYAQMTNYIWNQGNYYMDYDEPVSNLVKKFWENKSNPAQRIKDKVNADMYEEAIQNGADLDTMSAWEWDGENDDSDYWDYAPVIGMGQLAQRIFNKRCSPVLHLSEVVRKVDYSGSKIIVTTNLNTYSTSNLFLGVPLGCLKANTIQFVPALPNNKIQAINNIGFGIFQKLYVTFASPFWPTGKSVVSFVGRGQDSKYSEAWVVPGPNNMLIFFLGGRRAQQLASWSSQQIKADLQAELSKYTSNPVVVNNVYYTRWQADPFTLGGYSYAKVKTKTSDFNNIRSVIQQGNNRIWLVGEHTHPNLYSYAHGAYASGQRAANQAI